MATSPIAVKKRRRQPFLSHEKVNICNLFDTFVEEAPSASHNEIAKTVATSLGIHWVSVLKIVKEKRTTNVLKSPKKERQRKNVLNSLDSFTENALRRKVHEFISRNEIPTLDKILEVVNGDTTLQNYKRSTLHKLLRHIGFKFAKRSRNSVMNMNDREDLKNWRRNDLKAVKEARAAEKNIFYLDETCINEGHTKSSVRLDSTIQNARHAMMNGLSSGLKNPSDPPPPAPESEQSSQSSSGAQAQDSPEVPIVDPQSEQPGVRVEKSSSGNQLVIRVSDKNDSKTNVFNRFSVSDGYFENNIIVKEEQEDHQHENEESSEQMEAEEEPKEFSPGEEMFPAVQAVLGDQESGSQDTSKALKELNDTFRKYVSLYSERTQALRERTALDRERISLDREKLALDRARLQYEMDTIKTKNGSAPKSDS